MGNACARCWYNRINFIEHYLIIGFRKWGYFVAKYPCYVIVGAIIFTALCCIGLPFIESESDTVELYVPKNSESYKSYKHYGKTWALYEDATAPFSIFVSPNDNKDLSSQQNIFTVAHLIEFLRIHRLMTDIEVTHDDKTYTFDELCYTFENGNCAITSLLQFYDFNETLIENMFNGDINIIYPSQFSYYSDSVVSMVVILGQNISINEMNQVTKTPAFASYYALDSTLYDKAIIELFEDEYLALMEQEAKENTVFDIVYDSHNAFSKELNRAVGSDVPSFVISFILIGVFASFILMRFKRRQKHGLCAYKLDPMRNRSQMSIIGILSTICAVFGSFGLVGGLFRVKWNPVVAVAPFLLVGLGVDDMFVLLRAYELSNPSLSIDDRIALTMQRGGISILFTSITDLVAFCIGATSPFGSISAFCLYCGVGVFLDFLFQITLFLALMVYDSNPNTVCICCKRSNTPKTDGVPSNNKPVDEKNEVELATTATNNEPVENQQIGDDTNAVIGKQDADDISDKTLLSYMIEMKTASIVMDKLAEFILQHIAVKICILLLFVGYLCGALYGISGIYAYQDPIDLVPSDSHLISYYNLYEAYFDQVGRPMNIMLDKALDYSDDEVFNRIDALVTDMQQDECFESESYFTKSWIHSYRQYLFTHYGNNTNRSLFYQVLYDEYLESEHGEEYIQNIWNTAVIDANYDYVIDGMFNKEAIGSYAYQYINKSRLQIYISSRGIRTTSVANCLDNYKTIMKKYKDLGARYKLYIAVIAESDLVTIQQTIKSLAYAMIAACIISIVLIPYPTMTLFVISTVGQILFGVLGYMSLWGLPINTTTMINVVLSVGFSVDNAAHFCHAFINAPINQIPVRMTNKMERKARILFALNSVGMPILAGDISTIVALVPLIGSDTEIFVSFWKCISLVMLFGAAYSVLYLPVVLSFIGPVGVQDILEQEQDTHNNLKLQHNLATDNELNDDNNEAK